MILGGQAVWAGLLVWAVLEQPRRSGFLELDYFDPLLLSVPNLVAGILIGLALTTLAVRWNGKLSGPIASLLEQLEGRGWVATAIAVTATALWLLPAVTTDATLPEAGPLATGHIATQTGDYFAVVNGRTPLVDYIAQYANLLPLAVEPVLSALRPLDRSFSILMCVLSAIGLLAVYGVFREVTAGSWTALALYLPFVALSLFPWNDEGPFREFNGNYFGVLPGASSDRSCWPGSARSPCDGGFPLWALYRIRRASSSINNAEFGVRGPDRH